MQTIECGDYTKMACIDTRDSVLVSSAVRWLVHYCSRLSYRWNFTLIVARQSATIVRWYTLARWDHMYVQQGSTLPTFFSCCHSASWYSPGWWIGHGGLQYCLPSCSGLNTRFLCVRVGEVLDMLGKYASKRCISWPHFWCCTWQANTCDVQVSCCVHWGQGLYSDTSANKDNLFRNHIL
jgi:hypothetical protein